MGPPGWIGSCTEGAAVRPDLDSNLCCASSMQQAALTSVHAALCVRFPQSAPVRVHRVSRWDAQEAGPIPHCAAVTQHAGM